MGFDIRGNGGFPPFGGPGGLVLPSYTGTVIKWGLVLAGALLLFIGLNILRAIYTDWLWFDHLGFLGVFKTILWTRIWLFLVGTALFAALATVNIVIVRRLTRGDSVLQLPPETLRLLDRLVLIGVVAGVVLLSIIFGSVVAGRWDTVLRLMDSTSFSVADPVFQKDVAFYVFTLPVLRLIQGWFLGALIVLAVGVVGLYFTYYTLRGIPFAFTAQVRGHLAVLGSLILLDLAANHFLNRYDLLFASGGATFGASYADVNARLLAQVLLTVIAVASGLLLLGTLHPALKGQRGTRLAIGAVGLWVASAIGVGFLYPSSVQRFVVEPNELNRETPYIRRNIDFTRAAFALNGIQDRTILVQEELSAQALARNPETVSNLRLWDPRPLRDTYNQIQFLRLYYNFLDVDVDRYEVDGRYRQVLVGARELQPDNLPAEAQSWVNQRLQYTHGYGAAASPVTEFTPEGKPVFFAQDIPPIGSIAIDKRPEIYYGERSVNFVVVNSKTEELDYEPDVGEPVYKNYTGNGGIPISSFLRRVAYAWQFFDLNILVSDQVTVESRIQYRRTIQERISQVAPFLELDRDPYLVVEDGRLVWIQDAYTVSDRYPYATPFRDTFNYIRNSVKVVMDAYHGTLDFYVADPDDPLIRTYQNIFPDLFKPLEAMSPFLRAHLRYPEDLFTVQAEMYLQYHMQDTNQFFNKADQWDVPVEKFAGDTRTVLPYYVIMKLPGEEQAEFVLILPFTPWPTQDIPGILGKPRMVAWLAARMDGDDYGELVSFSFPAGEQIDGPFQVEARIDNDTEISQQFTLWDQAGSEVIRGNLLVIPIGESILYVEPIYLQAEGIALPELKRVILASSKKVVMEPCLEVAVVSLVGGAPAKCPSDEEAPPAPSAELPAKAQEIQRIREALKGVEDGFSELEKALKALSELIEQEEQQ